jgi:hypothetical protein
MEGKNIPEYWLMKLSDALEKNKKTRQYITSEQIFATALMLWNKDADKVPLKIWRRNFENSGIPWTRITRSIKLLLEWGLIKQTKLGTSWMEIMIEN